jgi:hypothetical protein
MALLVPRSWCATLLAALLCQITMAGESVMRTPQGHPGPHYRRTGRRATWIY